MFAALPGWVQDATLICGFVIALSGASAVVTKIVLSAIHGVTAEIDERIKVQVKPLEDKLDSTQDKLDETKVRLDRRDTEIDEQFRHIIGELSYNGGRSTKDLLLQNNEALQALAESMATLTNTKDEET